MLEERDVFDVRFGRKMMVLTWYFEENVMFVANILKKNVMFSRQNSVFSVVFCFKIWCSYVIRWENDIFSVILGRKHDVLSVMFWRKCDVFNVTIWHSVLSRRFWSKRDVFIVIFWKKNVMFWRWYFEEKCCFQCDILKKSWCL